MIKKLLTFCCLIILLAACKDTSTNSEDSNINIIDLSKLHHIKKEYKNLSDFAKDIEYIKLETKPECILGNIEPLHIGNKFVIVCNENEKQAYAFQKDGKFIGKIGQVGRGPGEYLIAKKAFVFPDIKEIHLYCLSEKKILRFDYNLEHIGDINIECRPDDIEIYQNQYYICAYNDKELKKNGGNDLIVRDPISFKKSKVLMKRDTTNLNTPTINPYPLSLIKKQDTLYYVREISKKKYLYRILQDEVKPVLLFKGELTDVMMENIFVHSFIGDNLHFWFRKHPHIYVQYYNLKTKTFSNWNIVNDIDKGPNLSINMYFDGKYMGYLHSSELATFLNNKETDSEYKKRKCKFPEKQKMLKEFALNGENDNPWIMLLVPKD